MGISVKKIKSTCIYMSKCGRTSLSRCRRNTAGFPECKGCKLVTRASDRWKMIDKKPYRKCRGCGKFLPVGMYYVRRIKRPDGTIYKTIEGLCKLCRSKKYERKRREEIWK